MKFNKYIAIALLALSSSSLFTACDDDDALGEAPRLFRPVATLESQNNDIVVTWENIKGASSYELELYRVTDTDAVTGENTYELYTQANCESSPYTFENLNWDEKYMVKIKCASSNKESDYYTTTDVNVNYISKITNSKAIDNAVRISWDQGGSIIRGIKAIPATEGMEPFTVAVSEAEYNRGYVDIFGLTPETQYTFQAFSSSNLEEMNNSTYAGRVNEKTTAAANYDEQFGAGNWMDLRNTPDEEATELLTTDEFWAQTQEGMGIILKGGFDYKMEATLNKSVSFITGPTLGDNARIVLQGAVKVDKNLTIEKIEFTNVNIYSKKAIAIDEEGKTFVETNKDKGFGGMQVINASGTGTTVNLIQFTNCQLEGFRALVRTQKNNDTFKNVVFEGCTINGVGDQGAVTTTNNAGNWENVSFKDCTLTNVVMLCDFRKTAGNLTVNIENCTFCYAPMEIKKNSNPMFRLGSNNNVTLNISKTLFGPSMATKDGGGSEVHTYTAGTNGSIYMDNAGAPANVSHSFKTNFAWTDLEGKTYPLNNLTELSMDENSLWQNPSQGDFKVIGAIGESGIGASRWF